MFRQLDLKGKVKDDTQLKTIHQNTISTIRPHEEVGGKVKKFSSTCSSPHTPNPPKVALTSILASGVDGRVVIWNT